MLKLKHSAIFLIAASLTPISHATNNLESNKVPTSALVADFFISNTADEPQPTINSGVQLSEIKVIDGVAYSKPLTQSKDDVVTISIGSTSIVYDPNNTSQKANTLPLVENGTYKFTFKRFNGETFNSTVELPEIPVFLAPAPNSIFNKNEAVTITWNELKNKPEYYVLAASFANGEFPDAFKELGETSIRFAPGFFAGCYGSVGLEFGIGMVNYGKGYGSTAALIQRSLPFSYEGQNAITSKFTNQQRIEQLLSSHKQPVDTPNLRWHFKK